MNARSTAFEFTCLGKRINEIVSAIFHSVIFNRCFGKFQYKQQNSYSIGTLGFEEIICDFIDFTYIRVASVDLAKTVNNQIKIFVDELRALNNQYTNAANPTNQTGRRPASALFNLDIVPESSQQHKKAQRRSLSSLYSTTSATGSISLEFLLKNKSRPFVFDSLVWEVWTLKINCLKDGLNESPFNKTSIEDQLFDKITSIVSIVNQPNAFLPAMPSESELDNVFDTSYSDIQPYNFKISYKVGGKDSNDARTSGSSEKGLGQMLGQPGQERLRKFFEKLSL